MSISLAQLSIDLLVHFTNSISLPREVHIDGLILEPYVEKDQNLYNILLDGRL